MKRSSLIAVFLFLAFAGCTTTRPPAEPVHVVIVGTTDVHGWFNGRTEVPQGRTEGVHSGGLAILASYVDVLRAENPGRVILVDSGDMFQGTLESNLFEGEAIIRGYNALGYAGAAVGNHEFDFGPLGPAAVARTPQEDELGALKRNARIATFPMLSANMREKATGRTPDWARPYTIVRAGGARVGIIGLSTPDTPNVTMAANVVDLEFTDPVEATIRAAGELRAQGADAIVVIAHIGGRCSNLADIHDVASCEQHQHANQILEKLPQGTIDAFFAGHTHARMRHMVNSVPAMQAGALSTEFSTLELWIDAGANKVVRSELRPHTALCSYVYEGTETCDTAKPPKEGAKFVPRVFRGRTIIPSVAMGTLFQSYLQRVAAKREEKLGIRTEAQFKREYHKESTLGNLLADAIRDATGADIGVMNSGGIRSDLRAGDLVYGDIFNVSPFDNYPSVVTMTGAQIAEAVRLTTSGERGILQVSGLRYTYDASKDLDKPGPERSRVVALTLANGQPLDPNATYRVAMPDFLSGGGDGLQPVMSQIPKERIAVDHSRPIRDVTIEALKRRPMPLVPKLEERITVINEKKT